MSFDWPMVKLGSLADFQEGYVNPSQREPAYFDGPIKWLRATDLNDSVVADTTRTLSDKGFKSAGKSALLFEPGTLAISKSGTIGRLGILGDYMCGNRAVINIKPKQNAVPRYIFFVLRHLRTTIETLAEGSVQKNLYVSTLSNLDVPAPPKEVQQAFADVLGVLDDRITLLRETNATLEAIAQALFKSWFVDFDPVRAKMAGRASEGMDEATAALFPDSLEETELGLVPNGWRSGCLADVAKTFKKAVVPSDLHAGVNYVGLEHMPRKSLSLAEWGDAAELESNKASFNKGDILFGKLRPYFHKVVVAPTSGVCSTDILVCQPTQAEHRGLATMYLFSDALISYADRLSNGAKMPRVNWSDIAKFPIAVPSSEISRAYTDAIEPLLSRMSHNTHASRSLASLRDTLLPRLISGQLRLPEAQAQIEQASA